ncbi:MAG TPA: penicillin-binding protein 2 [Quisquiliibacterium sp.]|nr:penicillin-binding protein 2 [Quisquiliibacterium sp.]HQD82751.1 penicillin-binding protein 2 [Quisquiliibacterium sp.]HQN12722.1 penicillin-binding protein 2 [Quisquiliibacterium sp.]
MIEVHDTERALRRLRLRLSLAWALVLVCFGVLVGRFVYLQVLRYADFHALAEDNRIALLPITPQRGLIYDRNGVLLADNLAAYTLEITPNRVQNIDRTIEELSRIIEIPARDQRRFKRLLADARSYEPIPIKTRVSDEELARFAVAKFRFPGVEIRARLFRTYPMGETASHVIGYIGRISPGDKRRIEENDQQVNYAGASHIGKVGIELSYEEPLRGRAGAEEVEVSAGGRTVRSLSRTPPIAGSNVILSIDVKLQKLVEEWFGNRRGALVAIEPSTGDVLAFVSKPTFDPNLFVDGIDPQSWQALNEDPDKPLLNRPLRGTYPPGSTYKPFMALAALTTGARTPEMSISDPGYFLLGGHRFRDSVPSGHGSVNLHKSIVVSSDTYYYKLAYDMGVDAIHDFMVPWKFGQLTGIDLENEVTGILPSSAWKNRRYKLKWLPGETPSIGIGQGYNAFTILQLAHATATLANDGVVMRPHVVKSIENPVTRERVDVVRAPSYRIDLRPEHLALVKSAMIDVNRFGTSRRVFAGAEYVAAGKTGTAQVIGIRQNERYDARRIAERHRDHSLFMAFAPAHQPRIAVALIVENGGFGAQAAAPIARKVFDYVLLGKVPGEPPAARAGGARAPEAEPEPNADERDVPESMEPEPVAPAAAPTQ